MLSTKSQGPTLYKQFEQFRLVGAASYPQEALRLTALRRSVPDSFAITIDYRRVAGLILTQTGRQAVRSVLPPDGECSHRLANLL